MPELRRGVRRGRESRKQPTDDNLEGHQQIDVTSNRRLTRGRRQEARANNTNTKRRCRRSNNRKAAAAVAAFDDDNVGFVRGSNQKAPSLEDKEAHSKQVGQEVGAFGGCGGGGNEGEGGIREEVGEREMDDYASGGGAAGRSGDRGLGEDDGTTAALPEKVSSSSRL